MEYLLLVFEFFYVNGWRVLIWLMLSLAIGLSIFFKADDLVYSQNAANFHTNLVTVLGILIGFSISVFATLLTVNNPNVELAKTERLNKSLFSQEMSQFDSVLIGLAYIIMVQGFLLVSDFIWPAFINIAGKAGKALFAINVSIICHVVIVLMRNILDFYFMLTKRN